MAYPEIVYHYTSADTLLKIVETKTIWATNLLYLNDVKESDHCIEMFRKHLPAFLKMRDPEDAAALQVALETIKTGAEGVPYVSSFSRLSDSLPQWRSYCSAGNGVSIGFRTSALNKGTLRKEIPEANKHLAFSNLYKVHYLEDDDFTLADELLNDCLTDFASLKELYFAMKENYGESFEDEDSEERGLPSDYELLQVEIASTASRVKHWAFSNEAEYRLIAPQDYFSDAVRFRASRNTVIPYMPIHLPEHHGGSFSDLVTHGYFIKEVIVGPTPNADLTIRALEEFFRRQQAPVEVRKSEVPYRDL